METNFLIILPSELKTETVTGSPERSLTKNVVPRINAISESLVSRSVLTPVAGENFAMGLLKNVLSGMPGAVGNRAKIH